MKIDFEDVHKHSRCAEDVMRLDSEDGPFKDGS
jgi:hypothetical protein